MKIAALVREKGILRRDENFEIVRDSQGNGIRDPGLFKSVKGIGWYIEEYGCCQVSLNLTDYRISSVHAVLEGVREVALREGVVVTGSELIGLIPIEAMLDAGRFYLERQSLNPGASEQQLIEMAIRSLGLRDLGEFDPDQRIIERRIGSDGPLVGMTIRDFVDTLGSDAPAPGGGSVASLCGAMAAGLAAMVGQLTTGKRGLEDQFEAMNSMAVEAQQLKDGFLYDVDADTAAFDQWMAARGLPKKTPEEKKARAQAIRAARREAIDVPLRVLERTTRTLELVEIALMGNPNCLSDAGVGALTAVACAEGAWYNVYINLDGFRDGEAAAEYRRRADQALEAAQTHAKTISSRIRKSLREAAS
jgi:glutamate formiminotransferase/formiminotetrahydrofolate cyclodeaminase